MPESPTRRRRRRTEPRWHPDVVGDRLIAVADTPIALAHRAGLPADGARVCDDIYAAPFPGTI